ncbi:MAG TPA: transcriptional regulator [Lactobacillus sp.]|nr:transcriptional regulator [Lactobacillus sp.]
MKIDVKTYLVEHDLTIYEVAKRSGYGYTTLHKSFNKRQTDATPLNIRDLDALAQAQHMQMWEILRDLESHYMN